MIKFVSKEKKLQLVFLIIYEVIIGTIALNFNFNALLYLATSWVLPTMFFLYKLRTDRSGYIFEALMWSIPNSILIDWVGHYSRAWNYWGNPLFASTGIIIFGIPLESFVWGSAFWIFYVVVYEYFFDENRAPGFGKKEKFMALSLVFFSLIIVLLINLYNPIVPLFYLLVLIFLLSIVVIFLIPYKRLIPRIIKFGFFVFTLGLLTEFFSLKLGLWTFPGGNSIKEILFFGYLMPIEEIIWWFVVPVAIATVHEIFADNHS